MACQTDKGEFAPKIVEYYRKLSKIIMLLLVPFLLAQMFL